MKICVRSLKTVEKNGGLDDYLKKTSNRVLAPEAIAIKNTILKHAKKDQNVS
jgi:ribosomal protein L28